MPGNSSAGISSDSTDYRSMQEFDNHEMVINVSDLNVGLRGIIAIHSTVLGPALGGTRLKPYQDYKTALADVLNLSRAMSYKCALANLPYGGGKAVIQEPVGVGREDLLSRYAQLVEKLQGLFKTGTDVGVSDEDVQHMAKFTSHMLGVTPGDRGDMTTSKSAALGVFESCKASLAHLFGSTSFEGKTITIKGVGKLGGELARLTHEQGAQVLIADIDENKCSELLELNPGIKQVPLEEIAFMEADIYAPCALGDEFSSSNASQLQCKIIAGGANNQLADPGAGLAVHRAGVLYAPDYVANAGGLIYVADELEPDGFSQERVLNRIGRIGETLASIFDRSAAENRPTYEVADAMAVEKIKAAQT